MENEDILNRWSEYITELYHDDRGPSHINNLSPQILEEKVQKSLKKMKKGKDAGPDNIPSEMLTALGEFFIKDPLCRRPAMPPTHYAADKTKNGPPSPGY